MKTRLLPILLLGLLAPLASGQAPPPDPSKDLLEEGRDLIRDGRYVDAVKMFRKADKAAGGSCVECQIGMAAAFNYLGAYKEVLKSVDIVLKLSQQPADQLRAYHHKGLALYGMAGEDLAKVKEAEEAFRRALELSGGQANPSRFSLGLTLLRQSRDEEGIALLKQYLEQEPGSPDAELARQLIENPVRARKKLVPDFDLVTLEGDFLTSDDLRGKVVLLDFWFTSCPPCVASVPELQRMSRRMKEDPFVLLSVSVDQDETELKDFIAKNRMHWPQVWDKDHTFTRKCKVDRYPTYVLVSHEGEILYSASGWGDGVERELGKKVTNAIREAKKTAAGR